MKHAFEKFDKEQGIWALDTNKAREAWSGIYVIDGVPRWKSNNKVPPVNYCTDFAEAGCSFDLRAAVAARVTAIASSLAKYRQTRSNRGYSKEAVVDILTGKRIKL